MDIKSLRRKLQRYSLSHGFLSAVFIEKGITTCIPFEFCFDFVILFIHGFLTARCYESLKVYFRITLLYLKRYVDTVPTMWIICVVFLRVRTPTASCRLSPTGSLFPHHQSPLNNSLSPVKPDWHASGRPISLYLCSTTSLEMILLQKVSL